MEYELLQELVIQTPGYPFKATTSGPDQFYLLC